VQVHPDVELHIRERADQAVNPEFERAVEALITSPKRICRSRSTGHEQSTAPER
jgi:hypothetical protein